MDQKPTAPISLQRHGPREEERDLQVEQDEQDRDEVVAHVELHARVLEGLEAAFVRRDLRGVGLLRRPCPCDGPADHLRSDADTDADQDEQEDRQVLVKVHRGQRSRRANARGRGPAGLLVLVPSARLELAQLSPLPPQDSVSTNFTTSAVVVSRPDSLRVALRRCACSIRTTTEFTPNRRPYAVHGSRAVRSSDHLRRDLRGARRAGRRRGQRGRGAAPCGAAPARRRRDLVADGAVTPRAPRGAPAATRSSTLPDAGGRELWPK